MCPLRNMTIFVIHTPVKILVSIPELNNLILTIFKKEFELEIKKILESSKNCRKFSKASKSTKKVCGILKLRLAYEEV